MGERGTVGIGIPGMISQRTGVVKNANSTWLIGKPLGARARGAARPAGAADERRELLRALRGDGRRRCGLRLRVRRDPRHRRRRRDHDRAARSRRREPHRRRVGPQPAAVAGRRRAAWAPVLLRPARLHRDLPLRVPGWSATTASTRASRAPRDEIVRAAAAGDARCVGHARAVPRPAGTRVSPSVVNLLDPDVIVLGGGMSNLPGSGGRRRSPPCDRTCSPTTSRR